MPLIRFSRALVVTGVLASLLFAQDPARLSRNQPSRALAIEGEELVATARPLLGTVRRDEMGQGFSQQAQLTFIPRGLNDALLLSFDAPAEGDYAIAALLTRGPDYGPVVFRVNRLPGARFDGRAAKLGVTRGEVIKSVRLRKGHNLISVNPEAVAGKGLAMFGLDALVLRPMTARGRVVEPGHRSISKASSTGPSRNTLLSRGDSRAAVRRLDGPSRDATKLEVRLLSGEFLQYGSTKTFVGEETLFFRWTTGAQGAAKGLWQVSDAPFADGSDPTPPGQSILASGFTKMAPSTPKIEQFSIESAKFAPKKTSSSKKYFVRVFPVDAAGKPTMDASQSVEITHAAPGKPTQFTTSGLYPELWNPMSVFVELNQFEVVRADEEDDDEPYLMVAAIYADGTTIDLTKPATSSVRVDHSTKTHGNVPRPHGDLGSGDKVALNFRWTRDILPLGLTFADLSKVGDTLLTTNTKIYILVIAMEEDAVNTEAVTAGWRAAVRVLKQELRTVVQGLNLATALQGGPKVDMAAIQKKVMDEAMRVVKMKVKTGDLFPLDDAADPDDFVALQVKEVTYEELRRAKTFWHPGQKRMYWRPIDLVFDLKNKDSKVHYRVFGKVGRPPTSGPR